MVVARSVMVVFMEACVAMFAPPSRRASRYWSADADVPRHRTMRRRALTVAFMGIWLAGNDTSMTSETSLFSSVTDATLASVAPTALLAFTQSGIKPLVLLVAAALA